MVEIDLLRHGTRTELAGPLPAGDYFTFVFRADRRPDAQVYHWGVREPFPEIAVPLKAPDPDIILGLGTVVATAYDRGRYDRKLDYSATPTPFFSAEVAAWIDERLTKAGKG